MLGDQRSDEIEVHPLWPVYVALFRAELRTDPRPDEVSVICGCPSHY
ncbi:hypothetical protein ACIQOW_06455 [Kitasatospora sp. NPDC091335]